MSYPWVVAVSSGLPAIVVAVTGVFILTLHVVRYRREREVQRIIDRVMGVDYGR